MGGTTNIMTNILEVENINHTWWRVTHRLYLPTYDMNSLNDPL